MEQNITLRDLLPHLSDAELEEADKDIDDYLAVVLRIFERKEAEKLETELKSLMDRRRYNLLRTASLTVCSDPHGDLNGSM